MKISIRNSYEDLSTFAANEIIQAVIHKKDAAICFAAGNTPQRTYEILAHRVKAEKIDFSHINVIGLDEWVGISPDDTGSCHYFLRKFIIDPLGIDPGKFKLFDALSKDLQQQCTLMDEHIDAVGGIDVVVLGIGMNGHLGFNEPGVSVKTRCHVIPLDPVTGAVGQKYFKKATELHHGITVGMAHLLASRKALLLANGKHKASIVAATINEPVSNSVPASALRVHPNSVFIIDREAASNL